MATYTESWPTATSDISTDQDLTWAEVAGDLAVVTEDSQNVVSRGGSSPNNTEEAVNFGRAEHDLDSDDHYAKNDYFLSSGSGRRSATACVRYASSADTCYFGYAEHNDTIRIYKRETGSDTQLAEQTNITTTGSKALRQEADGSGLTLFLDDVEELSATDSGITGNTRAGCGINGGGDTSKHHGVSFETADLSTGVTASIGQAVETSTAQSVATAKVATVGQAVESSTAQPVTASLGGQEVAVGQATETSTALAVSTMLGTAAPAPDSRTLTVEAEDRTLVVASEDRTLTVEAEDRTLVVKG